MSQHRSSSSSSSGTYEAYHLNSAQSYTRPAVLFHSPSSPSLADSTQPETQSIQTFHSALPQYTSTPLHSLPDVARSVGVSHVFVKDESFRFGLPAFKMLGASWAIHCAVCEKLELDPAASTLMSVRDELQSLQSNADSRVELVTCTEGNWGRACSRYAEWIGVKITVFVPGFMSDLTRRLIEGEGAEVVVLKDGSYDDAVAAAVQHARQHPQALLMLDTSFDGYHTIPQWVTDGYTTMLTEADSQLSALSPTLVANTLFVSVGVGSWAHAVVSHYHASSASSFGDTITRILSVEPTAAACLKESLHCNALTSVQTRETIMAGMCCGTPSAIAWPVLRDGLAGAVAVEDIEAHREVEFLKTKDIHVGPCGAATLAAFKKWIDCVKISEHEKQRMVVVLFSTEGAREYAVQK